MKNLQEIERKARDLLVEILNRIPRVRLNPHQWVGRETGQPSDPGYDLSWLAEENGQSWELRIQVKSIGHPKQAREAAFWMKRSIEGTEPDPKVYPIFVAPYISPEAANVCTEEGLGYLDLSGNCHLAFGGVYIDVQGRPNQFKSDRILKSLYSPKAERILRVMLANRIRPWKVQELADECEVSLGQVSNVRKLLLEREWARDSKEGIEMRDPEIVLKSWQTERPRDRDHREEFFTLELADQFAGKIQNISYGLGQRGALTGLAAAVRFAPMSRHLKTWVFVDSINPFVEEMNLKRVDTGSNVVLIQPTDDGVFYGMQLVGGGVPVVSPVQVYLDLIAGGGRWEEAAEALLKQVIEKEWNGKTT